MENHIILVLSAFIISTVCGFIIIPYIINFCIRKKLYDIPNARKIHQNVIPRLGGICFLEFQFSTTSQDANSSR